MTTIGTVIASVSRNAGGLFESVRNLTTAVVDHTRFDNVIFGLRDENTDRDIGHWAPLRPRVFSVAGPRVFGFAPGLYRTLMDEPLDIMHNHGIWMYPSVAVRKCGRERSIPYVTSVHGMLDPWALSHSRWKKALARAAYEDQHLANAACVRALCEAEAAAIRSFGLKCPICIVPNGVNLPPQDGPLQAPTWAGRVPQGKKVLLYLGRIHPKKGLRNLLQAWASLGRRNASGLAQWHLVIAGWDQAGHERELKALCASLGIEDQVTFAGAQFDAHKDATFRKASAFILPSFGEGMPMVVLEAWSYRLPVLMTPQCNLVDAIDMGAALRIEPQVESIASGIDALFSLSSRDAAVMADKGRALVETRFVWEKIGVEMGRVYDWVLGGGDTPESVSR